MRYTHFKNYGDYVLLLISPTDRYIQYRMPSMKPLTVKFCTLSTGTLYVQDSTFDFNTDNTTKQVMLDDSSGEIVDTKNNSTKIYFRVWENTVKSDKVAVFLKGWGNECKDMKIEDYGNSSEDYPCHITKIGSITRCTLLQFEKEQLQFYVIYYNKKNVTFIPKTTRWYYEYVFLNLLLTVAKSDVIQQQQQFKFTINNCIPLIIQDGDCNGFLELSTMKNLTFKEIQKRIKSIQDIQISFKYKKEKKIRYLEQMNKKKGKLLIEIGILKQQLNTQPSSGEYKKRLENTQTQLDEVNTEIDKMNQMMIPGTANTIKYDSVMKQSTDVKVSKIYIHNHKIYIVKDDNVHYNIIFGKQSEYPRLVPVSFDINEEITNDILSPTIDHIKKPFVKIRIRGEGWVYKPNSSTGYHSKEKLLPENGKTYIMFFIYTNTVSDNFYHIRYISPKDSQKRGVYDLVNIKDRNVTKGSSPIWSKDRDIILLLFTTGPEELSSEDENNEWNYADIDKYFVESNITRGNKSIITDVIESSSGGKLPHRTHHISRRHTRKHIQPTHNKYSRRRVQNHV